MSNSVPPKPDTRLRRRLLSVLLASVGIFLVIDLFDLIEFEQLFSDLSGEARIERIQWMLALLFWPLLPLGMAVSYFGYRIIRSGSFPPPGSKLIRPPRIETGKTALLRGWVAILTGLSLSGLAIYGAVIIPGELAKLL
jgi:hypothetical protein